uniref:Uncharacterized protein n=1 Tax=Junco hyemalis TaxID=40217 RepID=A0A8C5IJN7_JUNHY
WHRALGPRAEPPDPHCPSTQPPQPCCSPRERCPPWGSHPAPSCPLVPMLPPCQIHWDLLRRCSGIRSPVASGSPQSPALRCQAPAPRAVKHLLSTGLSSRMEGLCHTELLPKGSAELLSAQGAPALGASRGKICLLSWRVNGIR